MSDMILKENKEVEPKDLNIKDLIKSLTESQTIMNYAFAGFKTETEQKFNEVNTRIDEHDILIKKRIQLAPNEAKIRFMPYSEEMPVPPYRVVLTARPMLPISWFAGFSSANVNAICFTSSIVSGTESPSFSIQSFRTQRRFGPSEMLVSGNAISFPSKVQPCRISSP